MRERLLETPWRSNARQSYLQTHQDHNSRYQLNAERHLKWHIVGAVLQTTIAVLAHHAYPNHQTIAADFRNKTQAWVNGYSDRKSTRLNSSHT